MNESNQHSDRLLSSWKEIASVLNRGVRTVQRWEHLGLPVFRPTGAANNVVLATESELMRWAEQFRPRAESSDVSNRIEDYAERLTAVQERLREIRLRLTILETRVERLKSRAPLRLAS